MTGRVMTLGTSCQYTLLIPERLFPSRSAIPAILLYFHPPPPHGTGLGRCHPAAAAWRLERQRLTLAPHRNAWGTREFPAGGYSASPGRRGPCVPPSPRERPHALQAMRATPRPKKTGPEQATKRLGAAGAPVPRARGARQGHRLYPLPSAEQSAAARPLLGPRPPYLVPLSVDGAEHIGTLQNAGEEDSQAQLLLARKGQRRNRGSGESGGHAAATDGRRRERSEKARPQKLRTHAQRCAPDPPRGGRRAGRGAGGAGAAAIGPTRLRSIAK